MLAMSGLLSSAEGEGTVRLGEPIMAASHCSVQSGWVVIHYCLMLSRSMQTTESGRKPQLRRERLTGAIKHLLLHEVPLRGH